MPKKKSKISFIMPVYNSKKTVADAVESILTQDYPEVEVVLVDDGSNEATKKVLRRLEKKKRVTVLYRKHEGACQARNAGAKVATGDYFSFLPSDATLSPDAARRWVEALDELKEFAFLYGGYRFREKDGSPGHVFWSQPFDPYFHDQYPYIDGSFPLRREAYPWDNNGGWDPNIKSLQDWDFWLAVIKQKKGKGLYVQDIFFETEYPKEGGLSYDSSKHWLERTREIKEKWGIEESKICVTGPGAAFHAMNLAKTLGVDYRPTPAFKPHSFDVIYLIGYYLNHPVCQGVFAGFNGKKIIHWVGSDIWQLMHLSLVERRNIVSALNQFVDVHLAEFKHTAKELKELGIRVDGIVPLPSRKFFKPTPLPKKFTVAVYMPAQNQEFYFKEFCEKVAKSLPEFDFKFYGDPLTMHKRKNITSVGYVEDMDKFIRECSAIMRFTQHDGMPLSLVEFLSAGRRVLFNIKIPHVSYMSGLDLDMAKYHLTEMSKKGLNEEGMKYWRRHCSPAKYKKTILKLTEYEPKQYWEQRAEQWNQQASDFLPNLKKIQKELKEINPKSALDVGCGNGRFSRIFPKDYLGIDISEKLIKIAKERHPDRDFKAVGIESLYAPPRFDLAFSYTTLEHIKPEDFPFAVAELKDVAKKGIFIEPTDFQSRYYCFDHPYKDYFHIEKEVELKDNLTGNKLTLMVVDLRR